MKHPDATRLIAAARKADLPIYAVEQAWMEIGGEVRPVIRVVTAKTEPEKTETGPVEW